MPEYAYGCDILPTDYVLAVTCESTKFGSADEDCQSQVTHVSFMHEWQHVFVSLSILTPTVPCTHNMGTICNKVE